MSQTFEVVFGGQPYAVAQLPVLKARAWREQLIGSARVLSESLFRPTNGHDDHFFAGLGTAYLGFPDKLLEMIFAYGQDLPKAEITAAATDDELIAAFAAIVRVAFPYLHNLSLMVTFDVASRMEEASLENLQAAVNRSIQSAAANSTEDESDQEASNEDARNKEAPDGSTAETAPRYVSHREFFSLPIERGLANPNTKRFKRVQVVASQPAAASPSES
jgi:hypothetical protein